MDLGKLEDWADFIQFQEEENGVVFEDEDEKWEAIYEMNDQYLEDERMNLGGLEKKFDGKIIAIANLGLWNGRHNGYKLFNHMEDIFYSECDMGEWYVQGNKVLFEGVHHDGHNYYEYRILRSDRSEEAQQRFFDKICYNEPITPSMFAYYTKPLAPYVKEVYGWK